MKLNYNGPEDHKYEDKKCDRCDYHEPCCEDHKYAHCYPKSPCAYGILFECNNGTMAKIPSTTTATGAPINWVPRSLGCVSIDTSCLKMPTVKFDFNCIIQYRTIAASTVPSTLTFGLFKVCDNNGEEIPCGTWEYRVNFVDTPVEELTTSFCFSYCECASCPNCCTYYVRIIEANNPAVGGGISNILDVMAPSLSVMAKSSC
ncbi:hypothetical protein SDC9_68264 [bioreactor metagenome]|uniref:DUF4489 domain-containing protein n=2 Tax=root TaxID=1 RepID=A0ABS4K055_9CLOT|nr:MULTISPECIES: DUF4489 domain-containing protein [Clostridium]EQB86708.1 hypothetical protein M918_12630 [Clostridium sp. BL8]MBP2020506.1 hypothetical protein [Clostridium punense]